ncbi:MAG: SHOCT domain-containing protein [Nitrospinales bacterium]
MADRPIGAHGLCKTGFAALALVAVFLVAACAVPKERKLVKNGLTLQYISKISEDSELKDTPIEHPAQITEEQIKNHLLSLRYEQLSIFGKKRPVYTKKDVEKISRLLAKAFRRAPPGDIISYKVETSNGKTEGETFFSDNKINWRFKTIRGLGFVNSSSSNIRGTLAGLWRLVPQSGQRLHVSDQLFGKKKWENWIEANLNLRPARGMGSNKKGRTVKKRGRPEKRIAQPPKKHRGNPSKQPSFNGSPELEEKLEFLKNLRRKELIDDKEFERKRKELLDRFL